MEFLVKFFQDLPFPAWDKWAALVILGLAAAGLIVVLLARAAALLRANIIQKKVISQLSGNLYAAEVIKDSLKYYVRPGCQSIDPDGGEANFRTVATSQEMFGKMKEILSGDSSYHYLFLLADSGMGKTSFLINYFGTQFTGQQIIKYEILSLDTPKVNERIIAIAKKNITVLFLDGLDEDPKAAASAAGRVRELMAITGEFFKVVITCRTRFFPEDEHLLREMSLSTSSTGPDDEAPQGGYHKLYISSFNSSQIRQYITRRYGGPRRAEHKRAQAILQTPSTVFTRPLLLANLDYFFNSSREFSTQFQVYQALFDAWLTGLQGPAGIPLTKLRTFLEKLAINMYKQRGERGGERIHEKTVMSAAGNWGIRLDQWKLNGRSLLNKDSAGYYQFSHRTILEYVLVEAYLDGEVDLSPQDMTDQMKEFLEGHKTAIAEQISLYTQQKSRLNQADFRNAELAEANLKGADLREANLIRADLTKADLSQANLSGALCRGVNMGVANLREADLRSAALGKANLVRADLSGTNLSGASLSLSDLTEATLWSAHLVKANLVNAKMGVAFLNSAKLMGADLKGAYLSGAGFSGTDLQDANLAEANLSGADLEGAINLTAGQLSKAGTLYHARLDSRLEQEVKQLKPELFDKLSSTG